MVLAVWVHVRVGACVCECACVRACVRECVYVCVHKGGEGVCVLGSRDL